MSDQARRLVLWQPTVVSVLQPLCVQGGLLDFFECADPLRMAGFYVKLTRCAVEGALNIHGRSYVTGTCGEQ